MMSPPGSEKALMDKKWLVYSFEKVCKTRREYNLAKFRMASAGGTAASQAAKNLLFSARPKGELRPKKKRRIERKLISKIVLARARGERLVKEVAISFALSQNRQIVSVRIPSLSNFDGLSQNI